MERTWATCACFSRYIPFPGFMSKTVISFPTVSFYRYAKGVQGYSPPERLLPVPRGHQLLSQDYSVLQLELDGFRLLPIHHCMGIATSVSYRLRILLNLHHTSADELHRLHRVDANKFKSSDYLQFKSNKGFCHLTQSSIDVSAIFPKSQKRKDFLFPLLSYLFYFHRKVREVL